MLASIGYVYKRTASKEQGEEALAQQTYMIDCRAFLPLQGMCMSAQQPRSRAQHGGLALAVIFPCLSPLYPLRAAFGEHMLASIGYVYERTAAKEQGKNPMYLGVPFVGEWLRERGRLLHTHASAVVGECGAAGCSAAGCCAVILDARGMMR
ncbi:unnamed protein product [Closterium sp. NIES-54]